MAKVLPLDSLDLHLAQQTVALIEVNEQVREFCELVPRVLRDAQAVGKTFLESLPSEAGEAMDKAAHEAIGVMAVEVARLAQKIAGEAAAAERVSARSHALNNILTGAIVCAVFFGCAGYLIRWSMDYSGMAESKALLAAANKRVSEADTVTQNKVKNAVSEVSAVSAAEIKRVKEQAGWVGTPDGQFFLKHAIQFNQCTQFQWQTIKTVDGKKGCYVKPSGWFASDILIGEMRAPPIN